MSMLNTIKKTIPSKKFPQLYPWTNKNQFVDHLLENIVYNKEGIVCLNKPYGIPAKKNPSSTPESLFSIEEVLGDLSAALKFSILKPVKLTERCTSGISLFVENEELSQKIKKSYQVNFSLNIPTYKYLAVTTGDMVSKESQKTVGLTWQTLKNETGKTPFLVKKYSRKSVKNQDTQEFKLKYKVLKEIKDLGVTSNLVEIDTMSNKNHILRIFMSHCLGPVLGDHLYGNRVQEVLGRRMEINPIQADKLSTFQKVPKEILRKLHLIDSSKIPNCLHLQQITLSHYFKKDPLVIHALPPNYFQYICDQLMLS